MNEMPEAVRGAGTLRVNQRPEDRRKPEDLSVGSLRWHKAMYSSYGDTYYDEYSLTLLRNLDRLHSAK